MSGLYSAVLDSILVSVGHAPSGFGIFSFFLYASFYDHEYLKHSVPRKKSNDVSQFVVARAFEHIVASECVSVLGLA